MKEHQYQGACHCKNIEFIFYSDHSIKTLERRICDCDFCRMHGYSIISDPDGALEITLHKTNELLFLRQGSGSASFMVCKKCGVMPITTFQTNNTTYGCINANCLNILTQLENTKLVSPKALSQQEKEARWKQIWIPKIVFSIEGTKHLSLQKAIRGPNS